MTRITISGDSRDSLLQLEEDHFHDLKAKEIKPSKLSESISAFANAAGGEIFVGVREVKEGATKTRVWSGFADAEEANPILQMLNQIAPLADFILWTFLDCVGEAGLVLKIEILRNAQIVYATDNQAYLRKGAQKLPVAAGTAMERLRLDKGISSYEDYTVNTSSSDITNSIVTIGFLIGVIPTGEPESWLRKQKLIVGDKPTVSGILLFADEPQALLPKRSAIKLFRYATNASEGSRDTLSFDPITLEGHAYQLIYDAVSKTQSVVEDIKQLGERGFVEFTYPSETLHEIITNAVLHRDYSIAADIQIRVFDNRIEVESPGKLAGHVTTENILQTQFARNQRLVRLINKFPNPPNKDVGEGLNTAFEAMKKLRLKEPVIVETTSSVRVIIPHQKLASPEDTVMEYLETHNQISNKVARDLCGIRSENSMKSVFKRLEGRGMIEQVPDRPRAKAAWQKKK